MDAARKLALPHQAKRPLDYRSRTRANLIDTRSHDLNVQEAAAGGATFSQVFQTTSRVLETGSGAIIDSESLIVRQRARR